MSVLFEDLRIEHHAAMLPRKETSLDVIEPTYRVVYFLRRSTITIVEFAGCFGMLDQNPDFERIRSRFSEKSRKEWNAAKGFFDSNKEFFKEIRNDYGGHFQTRHV